ncbi:MAG: glycosyltransferase family 92 protein [Elusimicrobiota bacterium]|nr:glycosyltransferase family 92 protein [Elusimicrobiota bacterium]
MKKIILKVFKVFINFVPSSSARKRLRKDLDNIFNFGLLTFIKYCKIKNGKFKRENIVFENEIAIVAIMKNEGPYLDEWICYHLIMGVEKFYLYDDESTDDTKEILKKYIEKGIVDYTYFPGPKHGRNKQLDCYGQTIKKYANKIKWVCAVDLDEFIVCKNSTLKEFLKSFDGFSQIFIRWKVYGSSGHKTKPAGLVLENYKHRADDKYRETYAKAIVNPRDFISTKSSHGFYVKGISVDANKNIVNPEIFFSMPVAALSLPIDKIWINHYYIKSFEEYMQRGKRGGVLDSFTHRNAELKRFFLQDKSDVFDAMDENIVSAVKKKICEFSV